MKVTHFQVLQDITGIMVVAKLWVLIYESGQMTSFDFDDIYANVFSFLENGVMYQLSSCDVYASQNKFNDVFESCIGNQHQPKYTFKKH